MTIQPYVDTRGVAAQVWLWLGYIARIHRLVCAKPILVTSMRRERSEYPSKHVPDVNGMVWAFDFSRHALDEVGEARSFVDQLNAMYSGQIRCLLEPEDLSAGIRDAVARVPGAGPCIHVSVISHDWPAAL